MSKRVKYSKILKKTEKFMIFVKEKYIDEKNRLLTIKNLHLFDIKQIDENKPKILDNIQKLEQSFLNHQLKLLSLKTEINMLENYLEKNSEGESEFERYYKRIEKETDEGITLRLKNLKKNLISKQSEYIKEKKRKISKVENEINISQYNRSIRTKTLIRSDLIKDIDAIEVDIQVINNNYNKKLKEIKDLLILLNDDNNNHKKILFILNFQSLLELEIHSDKKIKEDLNILNDLVTSTLN